MRGAFLISFVMKIFKKNNKKQSKKKVPVELTELSKQNIHKHPFMVPVFTFIFLIFGSFVLFLYAGGQTVEGDDVKRVQVSEDGHVKTIPTRAKTVGEVLDRLNIKLAKEDVVEPGINSPILEDDFSINVYKAKPVTVVDESGKKVITKIAESTPSGIAKKAGFKIYAEDYVEFASPDLALETGVIGDLITINRAVKADIILYGSSISVRTHAETVGDLLVEKNVHTLDGDNVLPSIDTKITEGMTIFVAPKGKKLTIKKEIIPAPVETKYDATLDVNTQKVLEPGKDGKRVVVYELKIVKGKEISRKEIQSIISVQPEKRVVVRGTKVAGFEGGFSAALATLRSCEGGYGSVNPAGYYGAYQFNLGTWQSSAPSGYKDVRPDQAPPAVQDQAASTLYQSRGWQPWPTCSVKLGLQDIYR